MQTVSTAIPVTVIATNRYSYLKVKASTPVTVNLTCEYLEPDSWSLTQ
jgi:hypothetical protein